MSIPAAMNGTRSDLAQWLRRHRRVLKLCLLNKRGGDLPTHTFCGLDAQGMRFLDFTIFPF